MKLTIQQATDVLQVCRNTAYDICRSPEKRRMLKMRIRRGSRGRLIIYLPDNGLLWRVRTMAETMHRSKRRIQQIIKQNRLESIKVGGQLRIPSIHGIKLIELRGGK
jgi:excisionase family DNA binding protein